MDDYFNERATTPFIIRPGDNEPQGYIHFRRSISRVSVNITPAENLQDFEITSTYIVNMPTLEWLATRADGEAGNATTNAGDVIARTGSNFGTSQRFYNLDKEGDSFVFDWWQMENRRKAVAPVQSYDKRELERKDKYPFQDPETENLVSNTGKYVALMGPDGDQYEHNNNATFFVINARFRQADPDHPEYVGLLAETTYVVHLGYIEGDKNSDFGCRRNTKYTYNVKINGVNAIITEASAETLDGDQFQHGAEGVVSEIREKLFICDSHFTQFAVTVSKEEIEHLDWAMIVYKDKNTMYKITSKNFTNFPKKYYDWVYIMKNDYGDLQNEFTRLYNMEKFDPQKAIPLYLASTPEYRNQLQAGVYTVFIDEYIYEDETTEPNLTHGQKTPSWKEYVNLPDRIGALTFGNLVSLDTESLMVQSKYVFRQKSLQTYYGTDPDDPDQAIALEHINETFGLKLLRTPLCPKTTMNGRYDMLKSSELAASNLWSSYLDFTRSFNYYDINEYQGTAEVGNEQTGLPGLRNENVARTAITACLTRNRDLNNDGIIQPEEVRWFLPDIVQYQNFAIGSHSLTTPLFNFSQYTAGVNGTNSSSDLMNNHKYVSSDQWFLWGAEYLSSGNQRTTLDGSGRDNEVRNIRCARYLGVDMKEDVSTKARPAPMPYNNNNNNNIITTYYGDESTRGYSSSSFEWNWEASLQNRPSARFEYKPDFLQIYAGAPLQEFRNYNGQTWFGNNNSAWQYLEAVNLKDPCEYKYGRGWRIANQAELAIMLNCGVLDPYTSPRVLSAQVSKLYTQPASNLNHRQFRIYGYYGNATNGASFHAYGGQWGGNMYVKCVRDRH